MALKWSDIDFKEKTIFVNSAVESGSKEIKGTKTDSGERIIPFPLVLYKDLKKAYDEKISLYVFTQKTNNNRMTHESMRCFWENFKRHLDISMGATVYRSQITNSVIADDLAPYCLRHTYCTDLQDAGVPLNVAKYLMGHKDIKVTANIYTHHSEMATKAARNKQNALIKKRFKEQTGNNEKYQDEITQ